MGERREMVVRRSGRWSGRARRPLIQIRIIRLIHNLCAAHSPQLTRVRHIYTVLRYESKTVASDVLYSCVLETRKEPKKIIIFLSPRQQINNIITMTN
jgi:hypothetical protein